MFTGIIETLGVIQEIKKENSNVHITMNSSITSELQIDQSVAHNGICLTVVAINDTFYTVTALDETIKKTNLADWKVGDSVNLERAMKLGDRLDGHIVQGHVDQTGVVTAIAEQDGSWLFDFEYSPDEQNITVEKGSICINGTSLTVFNSGINTFRVAIIPYTYENTVFHTFKVGDIVNLEFDIVGKYIKKMLKM